nr:capsule assembly Wzi family protein [Fibrobacterota bacterium]
VHWGPALLDNLVFHQDAIPFDQLTFTTSLGPLRIQTLYGRLVNEEDRIFNTQPASRSVYAHRYELSLTHNLLLGMSEQMIVFKHEAPFAFIPLVPLFIYKGDGWERLNNGNIAADICYRIPGIASLYSEFLIDDIQSPSSLFDNQWGNKWAWTAGAHAIKDIFQFKSGVIMEYTRLEPWIYTHYLASSAQTMNQGYPLGNQMGPNSQSIGVRPYFRSFDSFYISAQGDWIWKGTDAGSSAHNIPPTGIKSKVFLEGIKSPDFSFTPMAAWVHGTLSISSAWKFGNEAKGYMRVHVSYP